MDEILPKCYVLGVESTGKSALIRKFKENIEVREIDSMFVPITRSNGALLDVEIVESPIGSENEILISRFNAFILIYDISNRSSFQAISDLINDSKSKLKTKSFPNLIIVGNKCDLTDSREVSEEEGQNLSKHFKNSKFYEASTIQNTNVNKIFIKAADSIAQTSEQNIDTSCCLLI